MNIYWLISSAILLNNEWHCIDNTTGVNSTVETSNPSESSDFAPVSCVIRVLFENVVHIIVCLFSFSHCVVYPSLIYRF